MVSFYLYLVTWFPRRDDQFKSVTLGSNEEFFRSYKEWEVYYRKWVWLDPLIDKRLESAGGEECILDAYGESARRVKYISGAIRRLDELLERAEKNAQPPEVLAVIMHLIEQEFSPVFRQRGLFDCTGFGKFYRRNEFSIHLWEQLSELRRLEELWAEFSNSVASEHDSAYNVVVSAVVLLALVFQYLLGWADKGGSKAYSSGSLDFRDTFVCIVLFRGAYVWIKFRQASCPATRRKRKSLETPDQASPFSTHESHVPDHEGGVYRRAVKDKSGAVTHFKFEPRLKPPRERLESGTTLKFNCLPLGSYDTEHRARILYQIAASYYGKAEGEVQLEDGRRFSIPSMSEQEKSLSGKEKAEWVTCKTKAVYADFLEETDRQRVQLRNTTLMSNSQVGGAPTDPCIQSARITDLGNHGTERASPSVADPAPASDQFHWSRLTNPEFTLDELDSLCASYLVPQSSGLDSQLPTDGITDIDAHPGGCQLQAEGAAAPDSEHREPQLPSPPMESPHGQLNRLQQLVAQQKEELMDFGLLNVESKLSIVDLEDQLKESEVQKSNLEQKLKKSEANWEQKLIESEAKNSKLQRVIENMRSVLQHVPNFEAAT